MIAGFGMAAWAPLVPFAKTRAGIDDGVLGLLLLCLGFGSMLAMPFTGILAARFGCRAVIVVATVLLCMTLPFLALASSVAGLVLTLLVFGASIGALDVAMNIQAIIVERASGRAMMSGFHGLFSVGGIMGAGGVSAVLAAGGSPFLATMFVVALIAAALVAAAPHLLPYASEKAGPAFAIPRGIVLLIGLLCFVVFLAEGAVLDWSAVFLTSDRGVKAAYAGVGYAVFASAMTIGRLTGDRVVEKLGGRLITVAGGICAAAGFALAMLVPSWPAALVGFALVGVGCSNIVPVLFTSVGRQTVMPENAAVPAITTLGYAGILAGPAAIGFIADVSSLTLAFLIVAVMLIGVAATGRLLRF
jgi:predicted MFS family arabinose efflux permease